MMFYEDEIVAEVRRNREALLKEYGGIDGLHKHMKEERPRLEMEGWKFESTEESAIRKRVSQIK
jgi:hypothetical protein